MLTGGTCIRYLFGHVESIRTVAAARSSLWTGIILVLFTSIARNYDQTHISEDPFLWVFGSLLFSLVSGTWLFLVSYCGFTRQRMEGADRKAVWKQWPQFMGLFWLTAPVAWLYAIPVERFLEPVAAAKANVNLLAIVSIWRVLLMARVLQVISGAKFSRALIWILIPAAIEVLVVFFFGGALAQAIMRGMGGLRNSPAEDVVFDAMGWSLSVSFWGLPVLLLLGIFWQFRGVTKPFGPCQKSTTPWVFLLSLAIFWVSLAIPNQRQVMCNVLAETLMRNKRPTDLVGYYSSHSRQDFAPSRVLPPKIYEHDGQDSLLLMISSLDGKEAQWVRGLVVEKLTELENSSAPRWMKLEEWQAQSEKEKLKSMSFGYFGVSVALWRKAIPVWTQTPEGRKWIAAKPPLLIFIANEAAKTVAQEKSDEKHAEIAAESQRLLEVLKACGFEPAPAE